MNTQINHSDIGKIKQFIAYIIIVKAIILSCLLPGCSNDPDPGAGKKKEDDCPKLNCNIAYTITVTNNYEKAVSVSITANTRGTTLSMGGCPFCTEHSGSQSSAGGVCDTGAACTYKLEGYGGVTVSVTVDTVVSVRDSQFSITINSDGSVN